MDDHEERARRFRWEDNNEPYMKEIRAKAIETVKKAAATNLNMEYGLNDLEQAYTAEDIDDDQVPLSVDLVSFVLWLRHNTDYFEGPNLDIEFPQAFSPEFTEALGDLVITYTGE